MQRSSDSVSGDDSVGEEGVQWTFSCVVCKKINECTHYRYRKDRPVLLCKWCCRHSCYYCNEQMCATCGYEDSTGKGKKCCTDCFDKYELKCRLCKTPHLDTKSCFKSDKIRDGFTVFICTDCIEIVLRAEDVDSFPRHTRL